MARLRKAVAYRRLERPYTRKSKFRKLNFVRASPANKIVRYNMGNSKKSFPLTLSLVSKQDIQLRSNCIESARLTSNKLMETKIGKDSFYLQVRLFPHHILRENPLASGAGADRMSTGMKMSFGKPIGIAAQVRKGQKIFEISTTKEHMLTAKLALQRASKKLPNSCAIVITENQPVIQPVIQPVAV